MVYYIYPDMYHFCCFSSSPSSRLPSSTISLLFEELSLALFKVNLLATNFLPLRMSLSLHLSGYSHWTKVLSLQDLRNVLLFALHDFWSKVNSPISLFYFFLLSLYSVRFQDFSLCLKRSGVWLGVSGHGFLWADSVWYSLRLLNLWVPIYPLANVSAVLSAAPFSAHLPLSFRARRTGRSHPVLVSPRSLRTCAFFKISLFFFLLGNVYWCTDVFYKFTDFFLRCFHFAVESISSCFISVIELFRSKVPICSSLCLLVSGRLFIYLFHECLLLHRKP